MKKTIQMTLVATAAASGAMSAGAQSFTTEYTWDIEPKPLAPMLTEFSQRTGIAISYVSRGGRKLGEGDPMLIARTSFSLNAPSGYSAMLFVDNVFNEDGAFVRYGQAEHINVRGRPRSMGLQFEYSFR